ncbi:MAG: 6-carboxytetrahydropterin synthase QueD [Deltaproteobacteria bacterium]|nr:6-carboxytetrahydropterin synthase QueD [Deltaproteobacteria bacterium]
MKKELYTLAVRSSFAAAHRLRDYEGNCERLHGHNWQVEALVESEELDARGMALDFREMKGALNDIISRLDHKYLNEIPPFDAQNPSSESIAKYIFDEMERKIPGPARLARVIVWESDDARAEFSRRS